jgi:hypothetical protein
MIPTSRARLGNGIKRGAFLLAAGNKKARLAAVLLFVALTLLVG